MFSYALIVVAPLELGPPELVDIRSLSSRALAKLETQTRQHSGSDFHDIFLATTASRLAILCGSDVSVEYMRLHLAPMLW